MIMPKGEALLLPARPAFIWTTLLIGLLVNLVPLGRAPWMPDVLMLLLLFWSLHQPQRIGIGTAFAFGLAIDVAHAGLLGQHAITYGLLAFLGAAVRRRVQWLSVLEQAVQLAPLFLLAQGLELLLRMLAGGVFPGLWVALAPLLETILWPVVSQLLLLPQRRPPDPDRNRPL